MTGGVVLGASRDLITLIIAMETLTLPLYVLVGLRRRTLASAEAAVTFFIVSVVSTAVTLLGAALLYGATGSVHFATLSQGLASRTDLRSVPLVGRGRRAGVGGPRLQGGGGAVPCLGAGDV